ncbi:MAG: hypothetical protein GOMPHAMPRED_004353 [Gomphillus americanus]|uniref:BZIP domain-containing protein n=1 Tax=Gomphillus americanus TaxID=1940652 RepID=A0A8H3FMG2_9LECA|nr:MAG: hypothetical protein GOMPHAMPRED_004353 [Gomphillus americanus]
MPVNAFRIFKPNSEKQAEDPVQRRRAQVRRAQRTYQERKNAYAKSLEDALSDSKAREAALCQKTEQLYNLLELLEDQIPVHLLDQYRHLASSRVPKPPASAIDFASETTFSSPNNLTSPGSVSHHHTPKPLPIPKEASVFTLQVASDTSVGWFHIGDFDESAVGMEFVLFLEKPCLGHIFGDPGTPHLASGHCLTASSQLLTISGNHDTIPTPDPLPISQTFPKVVLENLLRLASQVNVRSRDNDDDWEVTPIQAWDWLRQLAHFRQVEVSSLKRLANEMSRLAKCHGYVDCYRA